MSLFLRESGNEFVSFLVSFLEFYKQDGGFSSEKLLLFSPKQSLLLQSLRSHSLSALHFAPSLSPTLFSISCISTIAVRDLHNQLFSRSLAFSKHSNPILQSRCNFQHQRFSPSSPSSSSRSMLKLRALAQQLVIGIVASHPAPGQARHLCLPVPILSPPAISPTTLSQTTTLLPAVTVVAHTNARPRALGP